MTRGRELEGELMDALAPLGVEHVDMPITSESLWRTIRAARERSSHKL